MDSHHTQIIEEDLNTAHGHPLHSKEINAYQYPDYCINVHYKLLIDKFTEHSNNIKVNAVQLTNYNKTMQHLLVEH